MNRVNIGALKNIILEYSQFVNNERKHDKHKSMILETSGRAAIPRISAQYGCRSSVMKIAEAWLQFSVQLS
jgi:hypothetical protein